jgi:precorrin-6B methylase 2
MLLMVIFLILPLIAIISIFWPFIIGAGWSPTSKRVVREMLEIAEVGSGDIVYDLGSGDGRIVIEAARVYHARAVGIEADPFRILWSQLTVVIFNLRKRVRIVWGNFFHQDISEATVVTLFLWQETNQRLKPKLQEELKPGTRVVSYYWNFEGWTPVQEDKKERVYLYIMGKSDKEQSNEDESMTQG